MTPSPLWSAVGLVLLLAPVAHAETRTLTLAETLSLAVERNPDRTTAALAEQIAAISADRARLDRFTATVAANAGTQAGVVKPWDAAAYTAADASWDVHAIGGIPLYAGGAIQASIDRADASATAARLDREIAERSIQRAAYTAYWTIRGYELQIGASEEGLQLTKESLEVISAKANAGLAAGIDVNRSRVDLLSQEESLVQQKAALYQAEQDLLRLLHLPGDDVTLVDEPPAPSSAPVRLPEDAGSERPELRRKAAEAAQADASIRAAQAGALPTLALTGTAGLGSSASALSSTGVSTTFDAATLRPTFDASVGLQLSWNPFDLFKVRDSVAQARLASQQVEASTLAERDSVAADLRQAASRVEALRQRMPLSDEQVALARDNLQIVQSLYAQGSATILDLFNAQGSFRQARTSGASLRVELATAECDLRWLLGADPLASGATP